MTNDVREILDKAYNGSYYTILGCGGDLNEWKQGYQDMLNAEGIGTIKEWVEFSGQDINEYCEITDDLFPNDLHCLAFCLDGLHITKLAKFKLRMGDRWFDDIVDNNRRSYD